MSDIRGVRTDEDHEGAGEGNHLSLKSPRVDLSHTKPRRGDDEEREPQARAEEGVGSGRFRFASPLVHADIYACTLLVLQGKTKREGRGRQVNDERSDLPQLDPSAFRSLSLPLGSP